MTTKPLFDQLVRVTDLLIGPRAPDQPHLEWPGADEAGITAENSIEWQWEGHNVFARWFDDLDEMELLIVLTSVDPSADVGTIEASLYDLMPESIEIDSAETPHGPVLMVAYTCDEFTDLTDEEFVSELRELFDVARRLSLAVSA
jgi:hypothetical protein